MLVNFDVRSFCQNLRATKPPYECPLQNCGRIYKTYSGIQFHLYNFDHDGSNGGLSPHTPTAVGNKKGSKRGRWHHRQNRRSPTPPEFAAPTAAVAREGLTYAEAQKIVEVDLDGCLHRINICEPLDIVMLDPAETKTPEKAVEEKPPKSPTKGKSGKSKDHTKQKKDASAGNVVKLPEASFRIVSDYNPPDAPKRPASYYRFIEKSAEELDEAVEYDMDEEDCAWLQLMNDQRHAEGLSEVGADTFELLMDRLEKESYFQSQNSGRDLGPSIDEDAVCSICNDGECQNSNAILFCDMCNLAVHQECYGVPYIPEGQWLCRRCLQSPSRAVSCVLCPNAGGAFKQTEEGKWAHVVCALWVPEVCFANTVFLEPIDGLTNIPAARWKLTCYICKQRGVGACIQCHRANCYTAFHVTCAQQAGLYMKLEEVKESGGGGPSFNVRKTAYCDVHAPAHDDAVSIDGLVVSCRRDPTGDSDGEGKMDVVKKAKAKAKSREKMRKARKILAEKRSAVPVVSIPTIPNDRLSKIATMTNMAKKHQFLQRLLGYWTLKRQSRNGVPLLRRLQMTHQARRDPSSDEEAWALREQLKYWQRLRQDLERARLLVELIRKREKLKRELVRLDQRACEARLQPFTILLGQLLDQLRQQDTQEIFAVPVDLQEVPDYLNYIEKPMDFSTMEQKLKAQEYRTLDDFEADFHLIVRNCMAYNSKDTMYYRAAVKLQHQGGALIRQAKIQAERCGYDYTTGMHTTTPPSTSHVAESSEDLDTLLQSAAWQRMDTQQQLDTMRSKHDHAAATIRHAGMRAKRCRQINCYIMNLRRKLLHEKEKSKKQAASRGGDVSDGDSRVGASTAEGGDDESSSSSSSSSSSESESSEPPAPPPPPAKSRRGRPPKHRPPAPAEPSPVKSPPRLGAPSPKGGKGPRGTPQKQTLKGSPTPPVLTPQVPAPAPLPGEASRGAKGPGRPQLHPRAGSPPPSSEDGGSVGPSRPKRKLTERQSSLQEEGRESRSRTFLKRSRSESEAPLPPKNAPSSSERTESTAADAVSESSTSSNEESGSLTGVNRRTSVLFRKKGSAPNSPVKRVSRGRRSTDDHRNEAETTTNVFAAAAATTAESNLCAGGAISSEARPLITTPKKRGRVASLSSSATSTPSLTTAPFLAQPVPQTDSFKVYRSTTHEQGSDSDKESSSSSSASASSSSDLSDSQEASDAEDDDDGEDGTNHSTATSTNTSLRNEAGAIVGEQAERCVEKNAQTCKAGWAQSNGWSQDDQQLIPLEPLDLVWAKCRGYPWYPALIINPEMPRGGFTQNGVPIPVPPEEVLQLRTNYQEPVYLVLFFDTKRTWQWLPRNKLEPLGVDTARDKAKLVESKKPAERKAVKKAYENAILHRCRVTGESTGLSGDSSTED
ncbi:bromodomain-containing protein 1-like isoform X2 [Ornithodoros turicata]|uniref:bromodomain-containing protein 1-like isoform X2 n=1 Tax=Ornithodoros turicata TaxID=34597 RepID=UPI00313969D8